jgi:hypothetical protein
MELLLGRKVVDYFKNIPRVTIEKKVEQVTNIHRQNVSAIKKEFFSKF